MPGTTVEVAFELTVGDTPYFRLDDPVKGKLNNTSYRLAGPIWIDITDRVANVSIKRGKNRELERYNAGNASITLHNEDRTFDPLNMSSPYVGNIIPRRAVRVTTSGVTQFTGVIEDWNLDYDVSGKSNAQIVAADAFTLLAQQSLTAGTATAQTTGERINAVLSMPSVAWPLTQRNIDTGSSQVGADVWTTDDNALTYLQEVEASEQGQLFMDRNGYVRFVNGAVTPTTQGSWTLSRTNLVTNPSFEVGTTGWYGAGATISRDTGTYYSGVASLKVIAAGQWNDVQLASTISATPNTTYTVSYRVKGEAGKSLNTEIYQSSGGTLAGSSYSTTGSWQYPSFTFTTSSTATNIRLVIKNYYAGAHTFYVDNVLIEQTDQLRDYFDGSLPATFTTRYGWNGTANASTSYEETADVIAYPAFSDEGDGIPYTSATISYGTELLYNQVKVTSPTATSIANNEASQAIYGITTTDVETLLSTSNAVASLALFWVAKYGEPEYRFQDLEISLDGLSAADVETALNIELGDIVQIKFTPNGVGDSIQRYGQVNKIEHSITPDRHNIVFGFGSLQFSFLVLDDTGFGILNENVLAF